MALAVELREVEQQLVVVEELDLPVIEPTIVEEDKKACQLFPDSGNHQRSKHITFAIICIVLGVEIPIVVEREVI